MKIIDRLFLISLILILFGCTSDDESIDPVDQRLTEGYIVIGTNEDGTTTFAQYFEELPSGTIDLTQGQAFQTFSVSDVFNGAMYTPRTDGSNGFAKMSVNGNGEIVEEGILPTTGQNASLIRVRDSNTGIFVDPNDFTQVSVFDPQAMQESGNVDLSTATVFSNPEAEATSAVFRDDDIFVVVRTPRRSSNPLENFTMVRGSISSGTLGNQLNSTTQQTFTFNPIYRLTDEQGNLYIQHTGNLNPFAGNTGGLLRILAGKNEFDPNYDFRLALDPSLLLQSTRAFAYYQNGIGYAHIGLETPTDAAELLASVNGNFANLSKEQVNTLAFILTTSENGGWVEVDLNAKSVKRLPGIPQLSPFAATNVYFINDIPHFPIVNASGENALYRFDPNTNQSEVVFNVTGAALTSVIDLSANNLR